ncbi:MAG: hypothetical protein U5K79_16780 [Cyclobacteriaceae bacterium]|nr:hypothetical protein [Cyclobacteriaceae bacterium]
MEGECKKGLANGQGNAKGTDEYEGQFKDGLPHGTGTYIWANGDVYTGAWKKARKKARANSPKRMDGHQRLLAQR